MIHFFRKIREKLLAQGKVTNYLVYASGEVVLVVLGILIALYINNWNETRKNEIANKQLLVQLKEENTLNIHDLQQDLEYRDTINATLYAFHQFLKKEEIENQPEELRSYLTAMLRATSYGPANNYLKKYISSNTGSNSYLATQLIKLDMDQSFLKTVSTKALDFKFEKYYDYLASDIDFETMEIHSFDKLKKLEFRNNVILLESIEEGVLDKFEDTFAQQKLVDSLITLELD